MEVQYQIDSGERGGNWGPDSIQHNSSHFSENSFFHCQRLVLLEMTELPKHVSSPIVSSKGKEFTELDNKRTFFEFIYILHPLPRTPASDTLELVEIVRFQ